MTIKTMTLDELERWWEQHRDAEAYPSESSKCLIAVPLAATNEGFRTISVAPLDSENGEGEIDAYPEDIFGLIDAMPLDSELNQLAVYFDRKGNELVRNNEDDDGTIDGEGTPIDGAHCLDIIRAFKKETLGGTA